MFDLVLRRGLLSGIDGASAGLYLSGMPRLRRRIRGFFLLQSLLMVLALLVSLVRPFRGDAALSPLDHLAWRLAYFGFSLVFAKAWWTTRQPSQYRNLWAVSASCISLGGGLYFFWLGHSSLALVCRAMVTIILGATGFYLFCQGGAPPRPRAEGNVLAA